VEGLFGPPCPCAHPTHQNMPETPWRQGSSDCGQTSATDAIPSPLHRPGYDLASLQAFISTYDDNKYHNDRSTAPSLDGDEPQSLEVPVQPSWSGLNPLPSPASNVQGLSNRYLNGIGAWQADPISGFTSTLSLATADEHADDSEIPPYYPGLPNP